MHLGHLNVHIFASKSVPFRPMCGAKDSSLLSNVQEFHLRNLGRVWNMGYGWSDPGFSSAFFLCRVTAISYCIITGRIRAGRVSLKHWCYAGRNLNHVNIMLNGKWRDMSDLGLRSLGLLYIFGERLMYWHHILPTKEDKKDHNNLCIACIRPY